jgi:hypothetical protein
MRLFSAVGGKKSEDQAIGPENTNKEHGLEIIIPNIE